MRNWLFGAATATAVAISLVTPGFGKSTPLLVPENTPSTVVIPSVESPVAVAETRYVCQKKDACGRWKTVCVFVSIQNAYAWFDKQPSNARIIEEK